MEQSILKDQTRPGSLSSQPEVVQETPRIMESTTLPIKILNLQKITNSWGPALGSRLKHYYREWKLLIHDSWALDIIKNGMKIEFNTPPQQEHVKEYDLSEEDSEAVWEEIQALLQKGAIIRV